MTLFYLTDLDVKMISPLGGLGGFLRCLLIKAARVFFSHEQILAFSVTTFV